MTDKTFGSALLGSVFALAACTQSPGLPAADLSAPPAGTDLGAPTPDLHPPADDLRTPAADLRPPPADLRAPSADLRPPADLAPPPDMTAPRPVSGTFEVDYGAGGRFTYTDSYYTDASYYPPPQPAMIRIQQNSGHTVWIAYIGANARPGTVAIDPNLVAGSDKIGLILTENSGALPAALRGGWTARTGSGTLTGVDLRSGGQVEGSATGTLTHNSTGATATFQATFKAKLP